MAGKHCVQELYNANSFKLNDPEFIRTALIHAAHKASATLLDISVHPFPEQGVTAFALLAESHISFHSWPEVGYAAIDVFTCGEVTQPERACSFLADTFEAKGQHILTLDRYTPIVTSQDTEVNSVKIDTSSHTECERRTAISV